MQFSVITRTRLSGGDGTSHRQYTSTHCVARSHTVLTAKSLKWFHKRQRKKSRICCLKGSSHSLMEECVLLITFLWLCSSLIRSPQILFCQIIADSPRSRSNRWLSVSLTPVACSDQLTALRLWSPDSRNRKSLIQSFFKPLGHIPRAPTTVNIPPHHIHVLQFSQLSSKIIEFVSFCSLSFVFTLWFAGTTKSFWWQILFALLINTRFGLLKMADPFAS